MEFDLYIRGFADRKIDLGMRVMKLSAMGRGEIANSPSLGIRYRGLNLGPKGPTKILSRGRYATCLFSSPGSRVKTLQTLAFEPYARLWVLSVLSSLIIMAANIYSHAILPGGSYFH